MTLLRMARVYEFELHDAARAVETHLRVLEIEPKDADALAALDRLYLGAGMYDDLAEILRRRIEVVAGPRRAARAVLPPRRDLLPTRSAISTRRSPATRRVLEQESRNRRALEAIEAIHFRREAWQKLFETYEKLIDVADADAEMADIYARMARICVRRARTTRTRRSSCGAACSTSAARSRRRCRRSAELCTRARAVGGAGRDHRAPGRGRAGRPATRSRCTSSSAGSGRTSCSASATRSMRGSPPTGSTATTSRRCARWRGCIARRRRGTSCPRRCAGSSTSVS